MNLIETIKPGVEKFWLCSIAAMAWSAVGLCLDLLAAGWLQGVNSISRILLFIWGLALAAAVYPVIFKPFADQSLARFRAIRAERISFLAIQP